MQNFDYSIRIAQSDVTLDDKISIVTELCDSTFANIEDNNDKGYVEIRGACERELNKVIKIIKKYVKNDK